jgi:hypothetical protein
MMPCFHEPVDQNGGRSTGEKDAETWGRSEFLVEILWGNILIMKLLS